jgi:hypothetical protein
VCEEETLLAWSSRESMDFGVSQICIPTSMVTNCVALGKLQPLLVKGEQLDLLSRPAMRINYGNRVQAPRMDYRISASVLPLPVY